MAWRWRFFWLLFVFHLPAARVPGRDRLRQARHPVAAAVAVAAAGAAALLRLLVLLWRRRLSVSALHSFSLGARLIRSSATRRRRDLLMKSGWRTGSTLPCSAAPEATACRTADAQVLPRDPAAESVLPHPARDLAPHLVVALAGDHVLAAATVHPRNLTAVLLSLLRLGRPLHQALASARLVCPGLCRVQTARAKDLHAVPTAVAVMPARARPPGLPPSNGEGDTRPAPSAGLCRCSGPWPRARPAFSTLNR